VAEHLQALPAGSPAAASTVISFHEEALAEVRRRTDTPVSYLVEQVDERVLETARELGAAALGPSIAGLCLRAAAAVHEAGLALNPWPIHRPERPELDRACEAGCGHTGAPAWAQRELDVRLG